MAGQFGSVGAILVGTLVATLVAGCASEGAARARAEREDVAAVDWASLWPELARPGSAVEADELFPLRRPEQDELARLQAAERAWQAEDDVAFAKARDELAQDPVLAFWLSRMLVHDLVTRRQRAQPASLIGELPGQRPHDALVELGEAALPCAVLDLLRHRAADRRELGAELLRSIGPQAFPAWERLFDIADARTRRYALRAIGGWQGDARSLARLEQAVTDPDPFVRAEGWRGLGQRGSAMAPRLRDALRDEPDAYAQRAIIAALGSHPDLETAGLLVEYLERATAERDRDGQDAARRALMEIAGISEPGNAARWRVWLERRRAEHQH